MVKWIPNTARFTFNKTESEVLGSKSISVPYCLTSLGDHTCLFPVTVVCPCGGKAKQTELDFVNELVAITGFALVVTKGSI